MICPKCFANTGPTEHCEKCGVYFHSYVNYKSHQAKREVADLVTTEQGEVAEDATERIEFHSLKINAWALPICFALVCLAKLLKLPDMIFWYCFSIPTHEMGHAIAAWMGSRFAIPIGAVIPAAGFTAVGGKSHIITILVLAFWSTIAYLGIKTRHAFAIALSAFFIGNLMYWTFIADQSFADMFFVYGGAGGEFVLSTMLIFSFYFQMPDILRWDFFRFPMLFVGTYALSSSLTKWHKIALHIDPLPVGTFLSGSDDTTGDMNRLINTWHWKPDELAWSFYRLGKICGLLVLGCYLAFLAITWLSSRPRES